MTPAQKAVVFSIVFERATYSLLGGIVLLDIAYAMGQGGASGGRGAGLFASFIPLILIFVLIFVIFYFFLIRSRRKKTKHQGPVGADGAQKDIDRRR